MDRDTRRHLLLTLLWGLSLVPYFRWWGLTLRAAAVPLWTVGYTAGFAASATFQFGGRTAWTRPDVRTPVVTWAALALTAFLTVTLVPQIRLAGQPVQTSSFLLILEMVVPIWIIVSAIRLLWSSFRMRLLVLTAGPAVAAVSLFAYTMSMPAASFAGTPPPLTPSQQASSQRLEMTVQALAVTIGERNDTHYARLGQAASLVDSMLTAFGYAVVPLAFEYGGRTFQNFEATIPGADARDEIIVVGGHYDSVEGTPGADDNASGTAALLEVARLLHYERFARTVRFVAFTNEEPPFFNTEWMGSAQYARDAAARGDRIVAMLSLEGLGFYQDEPGSQGYPPPFSLFYPDVGNFVGFVGNLPSRALVRRAIATFRRTTDFPSEGLAAPEQIPGVWWSDHAPFWNRGFRAIMITDTAPFRNPHYHQSSDTADRLDYDRMARVVWGITEVIRDLANG